MKIICSSSFAKKNLRGLKKCVIVYVCSVGGFLELHIFSSFSPLSEKFQLLSPSIYGKDSWLPLPPLLLVLLPSADERSSKFSIFPL